MSITKRIDPDQKALEINLNPGIYGTFSEIGAGQEVARHFFQVGAAAGTVAKTMSAYDKTYSDEIYGIEESGRYVCESRLYKMLDHEFDLLHDRLSAEKEDCRFFVFADTVSAINYHRTIKGNGWLGVRFQDKVSGETNDVVLQVRMLDNDNVLQQQAVGILGVNMVYACYNYTDNIEVFLKSLVDTIKDRVFIGMVRLDGALFDHIEPRLLPLLLVKNGLCNVSMFDSTGNPVHQSEFLYKKDILVVKGKYRPLTLKNEDMYEKSVAQFTSEKNKKTRGIEVLSELCLDDLRNEAGEIDYSDYLYRTAILCKEGRTVVITSSNHHPSLVKYLEEQKFFRLGYAIGVKELLSIIEDTYAKNAGDREIAAIGELFTKKLKVYVYPFITNDGKVMNAKNAPIPSEIKFLFQHMLDNKQIVDIEDYKEKVLYIYSEDLLKHIQSGHDDWESGVSKSVKTLIKEKSLFNYPVQQFEFNY